MLTIKQPFGSCINKTMVFMEAQNPSMYSLLCKHKLIKGMCNVVTL